MLKKYVIVLVAGLLTCGFQNTLGSAAAQSIINDLKSGDVAKVAKAKATFAAQRWSPSDKVAISKAMGEASKGESSSSRGSSSSSRGGGSKGRGGQKPPKVPTPEVSEDEDESESDDESGSPLASSVYNASQLANSKSYKALAAKGAGSAFIDTLNSAHAVGKALKEANLEELQQGIVQNIGKAINDGIKA